MKYFMSLFVILVLALIALTETTNANPGQEQHDVNSVAEAIRYLLELENKQNFGRPRFRTPSQHERLIEDNVSSFNKLVYMLDQFDNVHLRPPRFGKRANENLSKEYVNNYLRYMMENQPETSKK